MSVTPLEQIRGYHLTDSHGRRQYVVRDKNAALDPTDIDGAAGLFDRDGREQIVLLGPDGNAFNPAINTKLYENVATDWAADKTGVIDATANFNLAAAAGSTFIPAGTYKINGVVNWPVDKDLVGAGAGVVKIKLGVGGQIKVGDRAVDTTFSGGQISGFKIDGQSTANVTGGMLYVGFCLKKKFADLWITDSAGDNVVIETAQNCTWDTCQIVNSARSCVVFDYGAGGHAFYNPEIANPTRHGVEFRQTGQSVGGYPTFLGPSNNTFYGGIVEYGAVASTFPLIYHGAGTNNQFYGFSSCPTSRTSTGAAAVSMEVAANAISTTATITSGSASITVANASGIIPLMGARVPGFPSGSVVSSVVGNVVTLFGAGATASSGAGTAVSFGAQSNSLSFDGLVTPGTATKTYGIEMKGGCTLTLSGRSTFTNHIAAFRTYSTDRIELDGPVSYFSTPVVWAAHPSDDTGAAGVESTIIRRVSGAGHDIVTPASASARALTLRRADQAQPHLVSYQAQTLISDGTFDPVTTGFGFYNDPVDSLHYFRAMSQLQTAMVKVTGAAGATTDARYFGRLAASGAPTGGTWRVGDWIIDQNGTVWACVTAGTPGTWSAGARPTYSNLSYPANASSLVLGDTAGSSMDSEHRVTLRGAITFTAGFAAGATLATITAAHRTPSAVQVFAGAKYDAGGVTTYAPVLVASTGAISSKIAFVATDSLFIDGVNYHAA